MGSFNEIMVIIAGTVATGGLGWSAVKFKRMMEAPDRIDEIQEDVKYLRTRIDGVYDHLIGKGSHQG